MANTAAADTLDEALQSGRPIAIANYPPYMLLKSDGTPSGTGPDIDRAILQSLGLKDITAKVMDYGAMIPSVQTKKVLFGSGGALNITAQRCEAVLSPTLQSVQALHSW
ncbi:MAG: transporter substrate-binding domain-containing protein [Mesorhizobium sp.]|nr:MAG: transporter substrate-binding domain-containing protein [Mesorhizobium sp.]RWM89358.1 MAG: transporter substrate-binding domain-containing protein [Mesorhizobium sp.]